MRATAFLRRIIGSSRGKRYPIAGSVLFPAQVSKSSAGGSRGGSGHSTVSTCSPSIREQEGLLVGPESKLAQDVADPSEEEVYQEEE